MGNVVQLEVLLRMWDAESAEVQVQIIKCEEEAEQLHTQVMPSHADGGCIEEQDADYAEEEGGIPGCIRVGEGSSLGF